MLRRLMFAALALSAFLALEGCGVNRLTAPQAANGANPPVVGNSDPVSQPVGGGSDDPSGDDPIMPGGRHAGGHPTDGDGTDKTLGGSNSAGGVIEADSLTASLDGAK